jgi:polyhydroxyalkanoate synthesis regulator phasin
MMRNVFVLLICLAALAAAAGLALAQNEKAPAPPVQAAPAPPPAATPGSTAILAAETPAPTPSPGAKRRPGEGDRDRDDRHGTGRTRVPPIFRDATDEEIADIMAFTGQYLPWLRTDLEKMRQGDPDRFRQTCRRLRFEVSQLRALKERDAAAFQKAIEERQLRTRSQDLAAKIRAATDPKEKEGLTNELRQVLARMFDAEMVTREAHLRGLEERLESLRKELKDRATHRQEIIDRRLDETLKGSPDPPPTSPPAEAQPKK